jgi:ribosomal protein S18 acetylase RimI-like enzyme
VTAGAGWDTGSVLIRKARGADIGAIRSIVESAYGAYIERIGIRPGPMDADHAGQVERGLVRVAEDGSVVGLVVLVEEPGQLLIENVAVAPNRQGEGIGRALLGHAEEAARGAGLGGVRLFTHEKMSENLALYARLGYREQERRDMGGFSLVFLRKSL